MNPPNDHILTIFGASGDLTRRKLIPSIYELFKQNLLPEGFAILGTGRKAFSDESFRDHLKSESKITDEAFLKQIFYVPVNTKDIESYSGLKDRLLELTKKLDIPGNYIFYLATPPGLYPTIAKALHHHSLSRDNGEHPGWKRVIVEKPFGYDLQSAKDLNRELLDYFAEDQIYRIDHYLGKETVQNIMVTRFSNSIFEPLWNRNYIDHVQITAAEEIGIELRSGYYDEIGALRDMVQNHLLHIVGMLAMEPPALSTSAAIRNETLKVFQSLRPLTENDIRKNVIKGQYAGRKFNGAYNPGYLEEEGVSKGSGTETYVAMKLNIDNWRWKDVPFFIRTGKRLPRRATEVVIQFRPTPHHIFCSNDNQQSTPNQLVIRIQPDEGLLLKFGLKIPGAGFKVQDVNMDFHYSDFADTHLPSAYERLLLDSMHGDLTLYSRGDATEVTWEYINPILETWKASPELNLYHYPIHSWGPEAAADLLKSYTGYNWKIPCENLSDGKECIEQ
ncbi:MAG: glucose-6-phosphate dehydrogenase [Bacteroidales bacterium]